MEELDASAHKAKVDVEESGAGQIEESGQEQ